MKLTIEQTEAAVFIEGQSTDARTRQTAIRIAQRCLRGIQTVLREEEWADADHEFGRIVLEELETLERADARRIEELEGSSPWI